MLRINQFGFTLTKGRNPTATRSVASQILPESGAKSRHLVGFYALRIAAIDAPNLAQGGHPERLLTSKLRRRPRTSAPGR